jgi:hypothetical protein
MAIILASTAPLLSPNASMGVMTELPLSLIPTFAVPLFVILHVICIAQARQWQPEQQAQVKKLAASQA